VTQPSPVRTASPRNLIEDLHAAYVRLIDDDRLEAWEELFTEPCRYQITTRENVERKLPLGILECTSRGMLRDRVEALRRVNVYEAHTYSHQISGLTYDERADGAYDARSNYLVVRTTADGEMQLFSAGVYADIITIDAGSAKFRERVVIAESRRIDTLLVRPL
jgi:anthranilate 1,2-dioxygenase small subunit